MRKTLFSFLFLLLLLRQLPAQSVNWDWAYPAYSMGADVAGAISTSPDGHSYVTGCFYDTASFGMHTVTSYGGPDIFLARYDSTGSCIWVTHAGSTDPANSYNDMGASVTQDANGYAYVTGSIRGIALFDTTHVGSANQVSCFVACYNPNGQLVWLREIKSSTFSSFCQDIAIDHAGNLYITGFINFGGGYTVFGSDTLFNRGSFLAKYDTNGNALFAKPLGSNSSNVALHSVAVDAHDNIFCAGEVSQGNDTILGLPVAPTVAGPFSVVSLLLKLDSLANPVWVKCSADTAGSSVRICSVCCDKLDVFICGKFWGTVNFGAQTVFEPNSSYEACLVKYDQNGNALWARQTSHNTTACCLGADALDVTADFTSTLFITGYFNGTPALGTFQLSGSTGTDAFVAAFDPGGNPLYTLTSSGVNPTTNGMSISTDGLGHAYVLGATLHGADFGSYLIPDFGGANDLAVARLHYDPPQLVQEQPAAAGVSLHAIAGNWLLHIDPALANRSPLFVVYDVSGREVLQIMVNDAENTIATAGLAPGIYSWQLLNGPERIAAGKAATF